jgi:Flp pilus assembly protein TadG
MIATSPRHGRSSRARPGRDRGSASVELTVAAPLLLLLLMLVVQFALWAHATHIAQAAANAGVQTARAYGSTADAGATDATTVLDHLAGTVLNHPRVAAARGATTATVTVTGDAAAVVPGLHLPVTATATAPRERVPGVP